MSNGILSGNGSYSNPYLIEDAKDLDYIRNIASSSRGIKFKLTNDIDMNVEPYNTGRGWTPIPSFMGTLDGDGHAIKHLYINDPELENVGLFSNLDSESTTQVVNLALLDVSITAKNNVGAIAGKITKTGDELKYASKTSIISTCYATGKISASNNAGSLVGVCEKIYGVSGNPVLYDYTKKYSNPCVNDCHSDIDLTITGDNCGGLFGVLSLDDKYKEYPFILQNCYFNGTIKCNNLITSKHIAGGDCKNIIFYDVYYDKNKLSNIVKSNDGVTGLTTVQLKNRQCLSPYGIRGINHENIDACIGGTRYADVWRFLPDSPPKLWYENTSNIFLFFNSEYHTYDTDANDWKTVAKDESGLIKDLSKGIKDFSTIPIPKLYELAQYNDTVAYICIKNGEYDKELVRYVDIIQRIKKAELKLDFIEYTPTKKYEHEDDFLIGITRVKDKNDFSFEYRYDTEKKVNSYDCGDMIQICSSSSHEKPQDEKHVDAKITTSTISKTPDYTGEINNDWDLEIISDTKKDRNTFSFDYKYDTEKLVSSIKDCPVSEVSYAEIRDKDRMENIVTSYMVSHSTDFSKKIASITINSARYSKYMMSVDNGANWLTFDKATKQWVNAELSDIHSIGVSKDDMNNPNTWDKFPSTCNSKIKVATAVHSESTSDKFSIRSFNIDFKENKAPEISDDKVIIHDDRIVFSGHVKDCENDTVTYQILTKGSGDEEWKQISPVTQGGFISENSEFDFKHEYMLTLFKSGNNILKIKLTDSRGIIVEKQYTFVLDVGNPSIVIKDYNNFNINAIINQNAGRKIKLRIFMNKKQIAPLRGYSEWKTVPYNLSYSWDSDVMAIGMPNTVKIEVVDDVSTATSQSVIVNGEYKNLLFRDRNNIYYSTDKGEILEQLDLGKIIGGEIADNYEVFLENHTGMELENVTVFINPEQQDEHIKIRVSETGGDDFVPCESFTYSGTMKHNDVKKFYVRAEADNIITAVQNNIYNIYAKGDPIIA